MKILIIGNPIASGGDVKKKMARLVSALQIKGHTPVAYLTKFAGDGKRHMSIIGDDMDRIVVVGGDGTLNEIINGIPPGFSTPVLQLPTGNANLLGHDLGLPRTPEGAADLIDHGKIIMADIATMNNTRFIMVAGAGFDAHITREVKKRRKGRISNLSYLAPFFRSLKKASELSYEVTIDEKIKTRGATILVSNVQCYAGMCTMAPDAGVETGLLDVIVFPEITLLSSAKYFLSARFGNVTRLKGVGYYKGKNIKITSENPIDMQLDGDYADRHQQVEIALFPSALPLVVPE